jgi:hypothetical protein
MVAASQETIAFARLTPHFQTEVFDVEVARSVDVRHPQGNVIQPAALEGTGLLHG